MRRRRAAARRPGSVSVSVPMPLDLRAHRDQALGEIGDLRLARGVVEHGLALGERRRHQQVLGGADRHVGKDDARAGEAVRRRRPRRSRPSARSRRPSGSRPFRCRSTGRVPMAQPPGSDTCASPLARQQRPQHQHRGAHLAHEVVGRGGSRRSSAHASVVPRRAGRAARRRARSRRRAAPAARPWSAMSARRGTLSSVERLVGQQAAAISGSAAFLAPETGICALERWPP